MEILGILILCFIGFIFLGLLGKLLGLILSILGWLMDGVWGCLGWIIIIFFIVVVLSVI